ncbi:acyl-CoA dehydrogenase [Halomonas shantousis]
MPLPLLDDRDLQFQLYEVLDTESLTSRPRYRDHDRTVFDATLQTARDIARDYFAGHNRKGDLEEPTFDGQHVRLVPETQAAWDAFAEAGFLAAHHGIEDGGLQLPEVVLRASMAYFYAANIATASYSMLSIGAANLIKTFATPELQARFLPPMLSGRFSGTMALTEPGQGSALADIRTTARLADGGRYRVFGHKMFISGGDHELTDNIVHLVLARIAGAPAGVQGISLFIVPKYDVNPDGSLGERNDVQLAGLLHKMGWRNTTSTVLNFGERDGAIGYLVGEPHQGLRYMFQMMNEARIGIGLGAAALAYQGYLHSLEYARERPQGRLPSSKDPSSTQVPIIRHADVRRMLLAQKAYAEGALSLCLYASSLAEDSHTAPDESARRDASLLLDLLTPVVKSWPSRYGVQANDLAIQVLGGSGYIREYSLEQYLRDNRLNPIHEGTEGIQALDLLGRKLAQQGGAGFTLFAAAVRDGLEQARAQPECATLIEPLEQALRTLETVSQDLLAQIQRDVDRGMANATLYLDMFGRVVVGWIWLRQALVAARALETTPAEKQQAFYHGKLQAARYFMEWELPQVGHQARLLSQGNAICYEMQDTWF